MLPAAVSYSSDDVSIVYRSRRGFEITWAPWIPQANVARAAELFRQQSRSVGGCVPFWIPTVSVTIAPVGSRSARLKSDVAAGHSSHLSRPQNVVSGGTAKLLASSPGDQSR